MLIEMLKNMNPNRIDEDQIKGLKIMLEHDSFKEFHPLILEKLAEINKLKKDEKEVVVGAFKMNAGTFYKTLNGSIVFCLGQTMDEIHIMRLVVIEGGYADPDLPGNLALQIFGDMRRYGCYAADEMGRCMAAIDTLNYPMHVVSQVYVTYKD